MLIGSVDVPDNIGAKDWAWFVSYYDQVLKGKTKDKPEQVYKKLGGTPPTKKTEKEGGE
jgi:hypothetical protein